MTLPTDVKELIPEFYSSDHMFLVNAEGVDFGERTSGGAHLHQALHVLLQHFWHPVKVMLHQKAACLLGPLRLCSGAGGASSWQ